MMMQCLVAGVDAPLGIDVAAFLAPTTCSQCSRFHRIWFTFRGVIAERVNTVFLPLEYFHYRLFEPLKI